MEVCSKRLVLSVVHSWAEDLLSRVELRGSTTQIDFHLFNIAISSKSTSWLTGCRAAFPNRRLYKVCPLKVLFLQPGHHNNCLTPAHSTFSSVASLPFLVIIQKSIVEELPVLSPRIKAVSPFRPFSAKLVTSKLHTSLRATCGNFKRLLNTILST
jgi:hypothetical protein